MDIRLFVTQSGNIALACYDGAFAQPLEAVELDYQTTMLSLRLQGVEEPLTLNCPVHYDAIECVKNQDQCTVGFYLQNKLAGAMFVPFHIVNMPGRDGVRWQ